MENNNNKNTNPLFHQQIGKALAEEYKQQRSLAIKLGIARAKTQKAVLLARVSSKHQERNLSPKAQVEKLKAFIEEKGGISVIVRNLEVNKDRQTQT